MEIIETGIEGLVIVQPKIYEDQRGYFMESFKSSFFNSFFPGINFVQENESYSSYGTLRGLHFQKEPYAQSKLVRCPHGQVLDIAVDLRMNSHTFGKAYSVILSGFNQKQLFIPKGFAHGFVVLSQSATFQYKVDMPYQPSSEDGILYNDPKLKIDWQIPEGEINLSDKDRKLQTLNQFIKKYHDKF